MKQEINRSINFLYNTVHSWLFGRWSQLAVAPRFNWHFMIHNNFSDIWTFLQKFCWCLHCNNKLKHHVFMSLLPFSKHCCPIYGDVQGCSSLKILLFLRFELLLNIKYSNSSSFFVPAYLFPSSLNPEILEGLLGSGLVYLHDISLLSY